MMLTDKMALDLIAFKEAEIKTRLLERAYDDCPSLFKSKHKCWQTKECSNPCAGRLMWLEYERWN